MSEQRYEPLPSIDQLPAWLWRRTGPRSRVAIGLALLATIVASAVLVPALQREKRARAAAEQQARVVHHRLAVQKLQREQRPRFGRSGQTARPAMLRDLEAAIVADARRRGLPGPILRAGCERFPKTVGDPPPERDPRVTSGSYACLAVTGEIDRSAATVGGALGRPLPRERRLHDRPVRAVQGRRPARPDPGPRGDHTPSVRGRAGCPHPEHPDPGVAR